jgi:uncharacterized protein (DUF1501 family)
MVGALLPAQQESGTSGVSGGADSGVKRGRVLVVIQLDGGNDGLNTVAPVSDPLYRKLRPTLALDPARTLPLADGLAFHPALRPLMPRWEAGELAIVQGVTYPNPNLSHFESMRIWQTGLIDASPNESLGWFGLATDPQAPDDRPPRNVFVGRGSVPVGLNGRRTATLALRRLEDLELADRDLAKSRATAPTGGGDPAATSRTALRHHVTRVQRQSLSAAEQLAPDIAKAKTMAAGAAGEPLLEAELQTVARLIERDIDASVFHVLQTGYDTHAGQAVPHERLLEELAGAIVAFFSRLTESGHADRVVAMTFSEFGRRADENQGQGTDHGIAGPMLLLGSTVRGGLHGVTPRLDDLDQGNLKGSADFRAVFGAATGSWLGLPAHERAGGVAPMAGLFRT